MSIKEILLVILGAVVANNLVFEGFMGLPVVLSGETSGRKALHTGLWVAVVMILSQAAYWPLGQLLFEKSMSYLGDIVMVAVIMIIVTVGRFVLSKKLGEAFALVAINSAVLGLCMNSMEQVAGFGTAMLNAVAAALGFLLAMLLFAGIKSRIDEKQVPTPFRGTPILLVAAFIIAMALTAYK